jgi:hypothetical protein
MTANIAGVIARMVILRQRHQLFNGADGLGNIPLEKQDFTPPLGGRYLARGVSGEAGTPTSTKCDGASL